jgi:DNA-binding NtrC family response regulator
LAPECQAKLLRVLENHCVTPVGSNENHNPNVRVIAATSRPLGKMIQEGKFRNELYYRLNVVSISLPPLRERPEDIVLLVRHFFEELSRTYNRPVPRVAPELIRALEAYDWPGNVRELRNCVESMFVLSDSSTITMDDLPEMILHGRHRNVRRIDVPEGYTLEDVERTVVFQTLDRCRGNRTLTARLLGISIRTLQRRLKIWANDRRWEFGRDGNGEASIDGFRESSASRENLGVSP